MTINLCCCEVKHRQERIKTDEGRDPVISGSDHRQTCFLFLPLVPSDNLTTRNLPIKQKKKQASPLCSESHNASVRPQCDHTHTLSDTTKHAHKQTVANAASQTGLAVNSRGYSSSWKKQRRQMRAARCLLMCVLVSVQNHTFKSFPSCSLVRLEAFRERSLDDAHTHKDKQSVNFLYLTFPTQPLLCPKFEGDALQKLSKNATHLHTDVCQVCLSGVFVCNVGQDLIEGFCVCVCVYVHIVRAGNGSA